MDRAEVGRFDRHMGRVFGSGTGTLPMPRWLL